MYLVIGANGFLGSYLIKNIKENTDEKIVAAARNIDICNDDETVHWVKCDVTDFESVTALKKCVGNEKELKIFYLAAFHHIDKIPLEPFTAWNVNITSLANFLNVFSDAKSLFFTSTDCVYGEGREIAHDYRFKESDPLLPICTYGIHKMTAEALVTGAGFNVSRMPFMLGKSLAKGKKHFYDNITESLKNGEKIRMLEGFLRSALDYDTAARLLVNLSEKQSKDRNVEQIINVCGDESYSKYDIGIVIADKLGVSPELVEKQPESAAEMFYKEKRAKTGLMDNSLLKDVLGLEEIKMKL